MTAEKQKIIDDLRKAREEEKLKGLGQELKEKLNMEDFDVSVTKL
jgi:hypothetical protein